jgi:hypothetical protein
MKARCNCGPAAVAGSKAGSLGVDEVISGRNTGGRGADTASIVSREGACKKCGWISGSMQTAAGGVPVVKTHLSFTDRWGAFKVRGGIGRSGYRIEPGLYAVGMPEGDSPVFVSANYKLSFDKLRAGLRGPDAWILVLDTRGINVWCAAGKGTFGTQELVKRIKGTRLKEIIRHRRVILPQLGATGISAHAVKKDCGFKVVYGPVKAGDIKKFIADGYKKSPAMRTVDFRLKDRMVLAPIELVHSLPLALIIFGVLALLHVLKFHTLGAGLAGEFVPYAGAIIAGTLLFPLLLPYLPFRAFALKGALIGVVWAMVISFFSSFSLFTLFGRLLVLTPITAFLALNFTGSSTYTSLAGVKIEVRIALPIFAGSLTAGVIITILNFFELTGGV